MYINKTDTLMILKYLIFFSFLKLQNRPRRKYNLDIFLTEIILYISSNLVIYRKNSLRCFLHCFLLLILKKSVLKLLIVFITLPKKIKYPTLSSYAWVSCIYLWSVIFQPESNFFCLKWELYILKILAKGELSCSSVFKKFTNAYILSKITITTTTMKRK